MTDANEYEDWDALVKSPGFLRLLAYAKSQWAGLAYKAKMKAALEKPNASEAAKIVDAVSDEVNLLLSHPQARIEQLTRLREVPRQTPSRRGSL